MRVGDVPWKEFASAVGRTDASGVTAPTLLFEGSLLEVATTLGQWQASSLADVRVSLPDRNVPPRSFTGAALLELIRDARILRGEEASRESRQV